ncbi:hypothetical protein [Nitratireductor sp. OM-1]|uniref:hypothetical protein n=1 Tax=Nitratireductor sp. OM-1 TaxID=1756988 RepID=UPI000DDCEF35|nr:hypothetical protein [Nitratireductor sp. OM-1]
MRMKDMGAMDSVFTHVDEKTGVSTHFNVTSMEDDWRVRARSPVHIPVDEAGASLFMAKRGIEKHRLDRLRGLPKLDPILILHWIDGTHLVVDGHHRYVAAYLDGHRGMLARMLPRSIWRRHVITDLPDEIGHSFIGSYSGIP